MTVGNDVAIRLDAALVKQAEALGIDVETLLGRTLALAVDRRRRETIAAELGADVAAYSDHVDRQGLWYRDYGWG